MDKRELVSYLIKNGAHVPFTSLDCPYDQDLIAVFYESVQDRNTPNVIAWKHAIFIYQENRKWVIGFSQYGKTIPLTTRKLIESLNKWFNTPSEFVFINYMEKVEPTAKGRLH